MNDRTTLLWFSSEPNLCLRAHQQFGDQAECSSCEVKFTSKCLSSIFSLQPTLRQRTMRERISLLAKLSGKSWSSVSTSLSTGHFCPVSLPERRPSYTFARLLFPLIWVCHRHLRCIVLCFVLFFKSFIIPKKHSIPFKIWMLSVFLKWWQRFSDNQIILQLIKTTKTANALELKR